MSYLGRKSGRAALTSADIPDSSITSAKIVAGAVAASDLADGEKINTNIALLAFKTAVNGSLAKYNLQDQVIDEYTDATGIDDTPSNNHSLTAGVYTGGAGGGGGTGISGGDSEDTSISGYTTHVFTSSGALTITGDGGNASILVVGGGGSGGDHYSGGGGAGGLVYDSVAALTANTYDIVIGAGGVVPTTATNGSGQGNNGEDTTFTINGGAMQYTAKGGGGGGSNGTLEPGLAGGSGGGANYTDNLTPGGTTQAGTTQGVTPDVSIGYAGGDGGPNGQASTYVAGGGGGAGGLGGDAVASHAGNGGAGYDARLVFGTAVGDGGYFASGGGGGYQSNAGWVGGTTTAGGGGQGAQDASNTGLEAGQANTGGGGGGAWTPNSTNAGVIGGSGVVLVRYANADFATFVVDDLVLQSTDTEAETQPTKADMVMLVEDAGNLVGTVNTHIKGHISRDSGVTFTQGTLVDEGDWGADKRILAFHDLDIDSDDQPDGVQMCYKITTHGADADYNTKIHATSIGWR